MTVREKILWALNSGAHDGDELLSTVRCNKSYLSDVAQALLSDGCITAVKDPRDARLRIYGITDAGKAELEYLKRRRAKAIPRPKPKKVVVPRVDAPTPAPSPSNFDAPFVPSGDVVFDLLRTCDRHPYMGQLLTGQAGKESQWITKTSN